MRRTAGAAAARLGDAAPLEPPLTSHGSSWRPLASDALEQEQAKAIRMLPALDACLLSDEHMETENHRAIFLLAK